ncbi:MAG: hypothetical protein ACR2MN_02975 [Acidimicrobiales bacterium]
MSAGDRIARSAKQAAEGPAKAPFRKPTGRASYPRRVTLDLDDTRYDFMREAAWQHRSSVAELLRSAIDLLAGDPTAMQKVAAAASVDAGPPISKTKRAARSTP